MSYINRQSAKDSETTQKITGTTATIPHSDQRASTATQLKQQNIMRAAHSPNIIQKLTAEEDEPLQGEFEAEAPAQLQEAAVPKPNNTGLPDNLKSGIENLSGYSMDDVKVHYNSDKPAQLNAHAYAQGSDIHLAPGQEKHLPHEAWHVVQQAQGRVKPTMQMKGEVPVNDDKGLEQEADIMGAKAIANGQNWKTPSTASVIPSSKHISQLQNKKAVMQLSSNEDQSGDESEAEAVMAKAANEIEQVNSGGALMETEVGFSDEALLHDAPVQSERKSIAVTFQKNAQSQAQTIYISPGQRNGLHIYAEQNGCNFHYQYQGVTYQGQFIVQGKFKTQTTQLAATVTGALNAGAAKAAYAPAPNLANGTLTFNGVNARNVTTGASGTSLNRQVSGSGVGKTRPNQWAQFLAMVGKSNPFKQGHHMHQDLGGDGTHDNLAPFTSSLNGLHYHRVESHVLTQTDAPPSSDQFADYSCTPVYGGNAGIQTWGKNKFNAMTGPNQLAAMVGAGVISAATAAAAAGAPSVAQLTLGRNWIDAYVNGTFPTSINCTVRFIDYTPPVPPPAAAPATTVATAPQNVNITNDF